MTIIKNVQYCTQQFNFLLRSVQNVSLTVIFLPNVLKQSTKHMCVKQHNFVDCRL